MADEKAPAKYDETQTVLRFLMVNDVYKLNNFASLKTAVDLEKSTGAAKAGIPGDNVVLTLAGDFLGPSLLSSIDNGKGMIACLKELGMDYLCFGNHECDVPFKEMDPDGNEKNPQFDRIKEFQQGSGTWINSNMRDYKLDLPEYALRDVKSNGAGTDRKVAFLGLNMGGNNYNTGAFGGAEATIEWDDDTGVIDVSKKLCKKIRRNETNVDAIVPLTHQDIKLDHMLAEWGEKNNEFPLIIAGHDHDYLTKKVAGRWVIKAGMDAKFFDVVDLVWEKDQPRGNRRGNAPVTYNQGMRTTAKHKADKAMAATVKKWYAPAEALKTKQVFSWPKKTTYYKYPVSLKGVRHMTQNPVAVMFVSNARIGMGVDALFVNTSQFSDKPGAIGQEFNAGDGVMYSFISTAMSYCPKTNYVAFQMKGKDIQELLRNTTEKFRLMQETYGSIDNNPLSTEEEDNHGFIWDDKLEVEGLGTGGNDGGLKIIKINGQPFVPDKVYRVGCADFPANNIIHKYIDEDVKLDIPEEGRDCPSVQISGFKIEAAQSMDFKVFKTLAPEYKTQIEAREKKVQATAKFTQEAMADLKLATSIAEAWKVVEEELQCIQFCKNVASGACESKDTTMKLLLAGSLFCQLLAVVFFVLMGMLMVGVDRILMADSYEFPYCSESDDEKACVEDTDPLLLCPASLEHEQYEVGDDDDDLTSTTVGNYLACVGGLCESRRACNDADCGGNLEYYQADDTEPLKCTDISGAVNVDENGDQPWTFLCKHDELVDDDDTYSCLRSMCGVIECTQAFCSQCVVNDGNDDECLEDCKDDICNTVFTDDSEGKLCADLFEGTYVDTVEEAFEIGWELFGIFAAASIALGMVLFNRVIARAKFLQKFYGDKVRLEIAAAQAEMKKLAGSGEPSEPPLGSAIVQYEKGIAVRISAKFPGQKTGQSLPKGTKFGYTEKAVLEYKGHTVNMYRLADGGGWVHDFNPKNPGGPGALELVVDA